MNFVSIFHQLIEELIQLSLFFFRLNLFSSRNLRYFHTFNQTDDNHSAISLLLLLSVFLPLIVFSFSFVCLHAFVLNILIFHFIFIIPFEILLSMTGSAFILHTLCVFLVVIVVVVGIFINVVSNTCGCVDL